VTLSIVPENSNGSLSVKLIGDPTSRPRSNPSPSENWTGMVRSSRPSAIFFPFLSNRKDGCLGPPRPDHSRRFVSLQVLRQINVESVDLLGTDVAGEQRRVVGS